MAQGAGAAAMGIAGDALLTAALSSMPYGFAVWDESRRLAAWNEQYLRLYHLPPERVRRGMSMRDMAELSVTTGDHGSLTVEDIEAIYRARLTDWAEPQVMLHRSGGRDIRTTSTYMPHTGWVVTHQDVTEEVRQANLAAAREAALASQNLRFDAAINNMLHGLSMFDADNRLIVCNRHYAELYGLPERLTRPGTSFWEMLKDGARTGMVSIADEAERFRVLSAVIEARRAFKENIKMANGRVVAILHQPMPDGGWISTHEDITEQHFNEERIRHLARHDALTDLPNRVLFREEMGKIEARIKRHEIIAVLCLDLDHFKAVNDTLGHAIGDAVLTTVARRLREASRETDVVARLGGDEFAILVGPLENPRHAGLVAGRIVRSMARPMEIEGNQIAIGCSVGIAMAPTDGTDSDTLLKNADLALYRAKAEGRGVYHFFEPGMDEQLKRRRELEIGLKNALDRSELRLAYQPMINLAENRICCLEALLRWDHPQRGAVGPAEFVPVAEETGMIVPIGEWVLNEACRAAARWPEAIRVAVNLSAVQFRHRGLVEAVERALAAAGLAADRLELEVTEALLLADTEATLDTLHRLRRMGVRVAMDDFGSGYSSLRYLKSFPFDKIKVDRAFIEGLSGEGDAMAIIRAMIGVGRNLGVATTAEGIETEEQLEAIRSQGCEEVQGFLFSPPLPASGVDALLGSLGTTPRRRAAVG